MKFYGYMKNYKSFQKYELLEQSNHYAINSIRIYFDSDMFWPMQLMIIKG